MSPRYPRDFRGYGRAGCNPNWPNDANVAVQIVLNYEEGGENNILHGDAASEAFLSEIVGAQPWEGQRHWNMESIYEYGGRVGFWRLHRLFTEMEIPITVYGVATALARAPEQVAAMLEADWEIASHGLKWIEYKDFSPEEELKHIEEAIALHNAVVGSPPKGWYTGRCSVNTVDLVADQGSLTYCSDSYSDELPYWHDEGKNPLLIIPYTLDANDMRFAIPAGFNSGDPFYTYLKDTFDVLYEEGSNGMPKMMNVGLHCRLAGRPGRFAALKRFLEYAKSHHGVWFPKRIDIAEHWIKTHPHQHKKRPSRLDREKFVGSYGGVFEHSPWIAERAYDAGLAPANDCADGLHACMVRQFRRAERDDKLAVLNAHPDLAGKLAAAKRLTAESTQEQASAGLDSLTDDERSTFSNLNDQYTNKFGFPFILAVKGKTKQEILENFQVRIDNDAGTEFDTACRQVERIALLRLTDMLP